MGPLHQPGPGAFLQSPFGRLFVHLSNERLLSAGRVLHTLQGWGLELWASRRVLRLHGIYCLAGTSEEISRKRSDIKEKCAILGDHILVWEAQQGVLETGMEAGSRQAESSARRAAEPGEDRRWGTGDGWAPAARLSGV